MDEKKLKEQSIKLLREYTKHNFVKITSSGDSAIFGALSLVKQHGYEEVLIPDQGGWLAYKTFPELLNFKITKLKTEYGLINPEELNKHKNAALLFASFAGYAAPQNIEAIATVCKQNNLMMIEDAAGSLTHTTLCNGKLSDIIVGSFGKWKIVNVGYGGFLSAKHWIITEKVRESGIFSLIKCNNMNYELFIKKLREAPRRLLFLIEKTREIKALCKKENFEMIHENAEGICIFVKWKTYQEKHIILSFCKKHNLDYKECPLYIKVLEKAISIEVKRLVE